MTAVALQATVHAPAQRREPRSVQPGPRPTIHLGASSAPGSDQPAIVARLATKATPGARYAPYTVRDLTVPALRAPSRAPPTPRYPPPRPKGGLQPPQQPGTRGYQAWGTGGLALPPPRPLPRSYKAPPGHTQETPPQPAAPHQGPRGQAPVSSRPIHRRATWVRPRAPIPPHVGTTQKGRDHTLRQQCQSRWGQILRQLGPSSRVAEALAASTRPEDVLELSLRRYAPSTLQNYLRHIALFLDYLSTAELSLDALTLSNITDYLFACDG